MNSQAVPNIFADTKNRKRDIFSRSRDMAEEFDKLRLASIRGQIHFIRSALDSGISVNQVLKGGWTPLMYACSVGNSEIVAYLLQQGADPNFHKELFTPLMAVCVSTCENEDDLADCLSGLLDAGAIKDAAERHRITPLMFASMTGRPRLVQGLADRGCRLDLQDCHGWTALFWAVNQGKSDVVQLLLKLGASVDVKDRKGQTPIELAKSKRMHKIEELFGNQGTLSNGLKPVGNAEDGRLVEFRNEANKTRIFDADMDRITIMKLFGWNYNSCKEQYKLCKTNGFDLNLMQPYIKGPHSVQDAVLAMRQVLTQIKNTYEKVSFIRLHLQGHPLNHPLEYSASSLTILQDLSNKSLHQAHILQGELNFLAQHTKQMDGSNSIIAADLIVQPKYSRKAKISSCLVLLAISIITLNKFKLISLPGKTYFWI